MNTTIPKTMPYVRWAIRRDFAEILEIERLCFEFPWSEEDFIRCLRQKFCIGMVAELHGHIVGFMVYEIHRTRIHLLNLAVMPAFQRRGVGAAMIAKLVQKLSPKRRTRIITETRESNLDAQLFFKALGFRAGSVLSDFYDDTTEDAYLFQYRVAQVRS